MSNMTENGCAVGTDLVKDEPARADILHGADLEVVPGAFCIRITHPAHNTQLH